MYYIFIDAEIRIQCKDQEWCPVNGRSPGTTYPWFVSVLEKNLWNTQKQLHNFKQLTLFSIEPFCGCHYLWKLSEPVLCILVPGFLYFSQWRWIPNHRNQSRGRKPTTSWNWNIELNAITCSKPSCHFTSSNQLSEDVMQQNRSCRPEFPSTSVLSDLWS